MTKRRPRRSRSTGFKAKVALAAIRWDKMLNELTEIFEVRPNQIVQWKQQLLSHAEKVFSRGGKKSAEPGLTVAELHAKIGKLTMENDIFETVLGPHLWCPRCSVNTMDKCGGNFVAKTILSLS